MRMGTLYPSWSHRPKWSSCFLLLKLYCSLTSTSQLFFKSYKYNNTNLCCLKKTHLCTTFSWTTRHGTAAEPPVHPWDVFRCLHFSPLKTTISFPHQPKPPHNFNLIIYHYQPVINHYQFLSSFMILHLHCHRLIIKPFQLLSFPSPAARITSSAATSAFSAEFAWGVSTCAMASRNQCSAKTGQVTVHHDISIIWILILVNKE